MYPCGGVGQRSRFHLYHRPAGLGEEQGDDGHRDMPQPDASKVDDTLPYLFKMLSVSVVGTIPWYCLCGQGE